jgi:uncharacterized membrane protein
VEVDLFMGTFSLAVAETLTPYTTACGPVAGGRATISPGGQPGPNTLISRAYSGPCAGNVGTGTVLAMGYGTGTIIAGTANDITTVFGSGATTLVPVPAPTP